MISVLHGFFYKPIAPPVKPKIKVRCTLFHFIKIYGSFSDSFSFLSKSLGYLSGSLFSIKKGLSEKGLNSLCAAKFNTYIHYTHFVSRMPLLVSFKLAYNILTISNSNNNSNFFSTESIALLNTIHLIGFLKIIFILLLFLPR